MLGKRGVGAPADGGDGRKCPEKRHGGLERGLLTAKGMKSTVHRIGAVAGLGLAALAQAQAHPGHDGDHGLVWEFRHLTDHPGATLLCGAVLAAAAWGAFAVRRRRVQGKAQSLRVAARKCGN